MSKTIHQKVVFKNTTAKRLYALYMDAKLHSATTGAVAKITAKEGSRFTAHDGYISGKNLQLTRNKLIVQSWRNSDWNKTIIDSTFIICFEEKGKDVIVHATHANIPDFELSNIDDGWHTYYWKPWKKFLAGEKVRKKKTM